MCTAVTCTHEDFYFGRNLDFETSFGEKIVITSRKFPFSFINCDNLTTHHAIMGMGIVSRNFPLFFDATNEHGLCMAALLFPEDAIYHHPETKKDNVASFELIPWILSQCENLSQAKKLLKNVNIADDSFSKEYPSSPLHWIVSDKTGSISVESVKDGLFIYDNPVGVLTNSPDFPSQMKNLEEYISDESCRLCAENLPGDFSSESRFVRAVYTKENSVSQDDEQSSVNHFFRILGSVFRMRGCVLENENKASKTHYSACINANKGIYYYTTHDNSSINAAKFSSVDINSDRVYVFPLETTWNVSFHR